MSFNKDDYARARLVKWRAESLAVLGRRAREGRFSVPQRWVAWLLMEKAGVPRALIAELWECPELDVVKYLRVAKAMMLFPPFAARIEYLMRTMPNFALHVPQRAEELCAD